MAVTDLYSLSDSDFVNHCAEIFPNNVKTHMYNHPSNVFSILHLNIRSSNSKMGQLELFYQNLM